MAIIEVRDLVRKFGDLVAVDNVSFTVEEGEVFGFLGPNGAGKTTTINVLCTLLKPTSGEAWLNGYHVVRDQAKARRSIGLVFQEPSLDDQLTAEENLNFHAILYDIPAAARAKRMEEVLKMVELYDRRKDSIKTFSGGMKRRLEIARGLMHYPRVLFLDEPTLGLDPQTRNLIWEYILQLREREGISIFLTTHYMDEAEHADRIAIIDYGKIVALDTPDNLRGLVGGDIITVKTTDDQLAAREISQRFGFQVNDGQNGLHFEVQKGEEFIPRLVEQLPVEILSISLRRPTLDDVFLKFTGRQIRDEELSSKDQWKARARRRGGPHP
ncbi:MAG: ATP-binding cassette domain-containing protein [Anaerolineae bacterium]|nr:ATP-binding cassette domain-containing protein [Anaerolineae bacterium]